LLKPIDEGFDLKYLGPSQKALPSELSQRCKNEQVLELPL